MKNTLETRLGIFVALAVIAAVLILETVGGTDFFQHGYRLLARFDNVQDLKVGDRVKMAGVEVGRVERIGIDETNNKVRVTMKMRKNVVVRTDSVATIKFTGLMGQSFLSLDFGTTGAPPASQDTELATKEQPDLSAMMEKIDSVASGVQNLTKSFTGAQLDNLIGPLTDFVKANKDPLTATISNMESVSFQVAHGQGTVGKLIYDDTLYKTALSTVSKFQDTAFNVNLTLADARKVVDQINSGQGTVGKLLKDDTLYREATATMTNAKEILQKVNQGQGTVGKLINDQEFYKNAKLTLQKVDQATEGLEDEGPLSILGIAVGRLF
jgi:phospholipid/cholesterol/gamma-HCH transport system substrate-binding protein